MKNYYFTQSANLKALFLFLGLTSIYSCSNDNESNMSDTSKKIEEKVVIANRNAGSLSFIDANTNVITKTLSIPNSNPMYVVYVPKTDRIYAGDRGGKKIHVIHPKTQEVESSINVGDGVFHMWADGQGKELWVMNDIDNTISVINLSTNSVTKTINVDLKPHDVFLTQDGSTAYVSVFTDSPTSDKIYKYSTSTYTKTGEASVGKDPHLFHANNRLFVACQSGKLYTLDSNTLNSISEKDYTGAHGIYPSPDYSKLFVSNITGGQLYSITSSTGDPISGPTTSPTATPHNIVINDKGSKMFVTHSGAAANTVSIYDINPLGGITYSTSVTAGTNPFGLTYYKREIN
ncbi:hypothetical protein ACM46_06595 [Chryseobacterium angstadtii]|uniref:Surface antigen n=1 Tax=Chryseobacterium angstadtii TaxID=558151 RepID=A0A0J7IGJ4_9FLAO|nr:YncE family protein [Chryseobacterium angstadtii]KMQ65548.1 hypothetical protein ACM46_06595 [Chryseobacterium angstadtii]